eukprot:g1885.t1
MMNDNAQIKVKKPYVKTWTEFFDAAKKMIAKTPKKTRYTMKYRHKDQDLVLKVTDDVTCVKYKTDQEIGVKRMTQLNDWAIAFMTKASSS